MRYKIGKTAHLAFALVILCALAAAQAGSPAHGAMHLRPRSQFSAAANSDAALQAVETPALSLAWGIVTFPGQTNSGVASVNKAGHMVGGYGPLLQENYTNHGFLLKKNKFTVLDYPGAGWTQPLAINDGNVIIGAYGPNPDGSGAAHGFKLVGKTYTSFDYPGASNTRPSGINKGGDIVGEALDSSDHGFLLSKGNFSAINYPGATYTIPWGVNNAGDIVGYYGLTYSDSHGFIYSNGTYTTLDYPGGYSQNYVGDMNDSGVVIGAYGDEMSVNGVVYLWEHCFIYQNNQFTSCDAPFGPAAVTEPWHLNDSGVITGTYVDSTATTYGFELTIGP